MPQLGERDLALLSSVIYCDEVVKGEEINLQRLAREMLEPDYVWDKVELCGDFGHIAKELGREAAVERFKEVLVEIRNSPQLQHIEIASPIHDLSRDGITAACFVDMRDNAVSAVFRGTDGTYKKWMDNFEGGGDAKLTPMQQTAVNYINGLPDKYQNITVTGHSKGGNLAACATLFCDRIKKCVSYDGQGFSEAFLEKYKKEIEANRHKIKTISARNDFVNILLFSVSGEMVFVENNLGLTGSFLEGHYITNLIFDNEFDENGNYTSFRQQDTRMKYLKKVLARTMMLMPVDFEEWFTDTILCPVAIFMGKDGMRLGDALDICIRCIKGVVLVHPVPFVLLLEGAVVCALAAFIATVVEEYTKEKVLEILKKIEYLARTIDEAIQKAAVTMGKKVLDFAATVKNVLVYIGNEVKEFFNKTFNAGYKYALENPQIKVDTQKLRRYAQELENINNRLGRLDSRLDSLYMQAGLLDLWNLLKADYRIGRSSRISHSADYLNETAGNFEAVEKNLMVQL